jgi:hypothetical protein
MCKRCECMELKRRWLLLHRRDDYAGQVAHWRRSRGQTVVAKMTPAIRDMYRQIFELLDEDGSGNLDLHEIAIALKLVGLHQSMTQLKKDVAKYGNSEGELNLHAFLLVIEASTTSAALAKREQASMQQARQRQHRRTHQQHHKNGARQPRRLGRQDDAAVPLARGRSEEKDRLPVLARERSHGHDTEGGQGGQLQEAGAEVEEQVRSEEQVLPFHLFLPAFSRKKNLEFVMSLGLKDSSTGLPYPLDESSAALGVAPSETEELLERLRAAAQHCKCPHRPSLLNILDLAEGRSTGLGAMVESWEASAYNNTD